MNYCINVMIGLCDCWSSRETQVALIAAISLCALLGLLTHMFPLQYRINLCLGQTSFLTNQTQ